MYEQTEQEILSNARDGDGLAFDELQRMYSPELTLFVQRLAGNGVDADDVVQTSFYALYRHLKDVESLSAIRAYLYRTARNLCYDALRRAGRFNHVPFEETNEVEEWQLTRTSASPDADAEWREILRLVARALNELPEMQRQTMLLYIESDMTYQEIADVMSVDVGTVKSRIHHARRNLRRQLGPVILRDSGMQKEV